MSIDNKAAIEQPAPLANDSTPIADLVRADIDARVALGMQRYGTKLKANNGRDALMDAYQEAIDLVFYLRQAIAERCDDGPSSAPWTGPDGKRTRDLTGGSR